MRFSDPKPPLDRRDPRVISRVSRSLHEDLEEGRAKHDVLENVLWEPELHLCGNDRYFFQAIHQESIRVPESVYAGRAMPYLVPSAAASIEITDRSLGIPRPGS